jgi:putative endonuclease
LVRAQEEEHKPCKNARLFAFSGMTFYIYILYSEKFNKYYVGHSDDPWRRINEHNHGKFHKFTSDYRPWEIAAVFRVGDDRGTALKTEKWIKKQKSRKLIEKLIDPDFVPGKSLAQLVRVPHMRD